MTQGNKDSFITRKPNELPSASERSQLIQALRDKGLKISDLNKIIKDGKNRKQIRDALIELLRNQ